MGYRACAWGRRGSIRLYGAACGPVVGACAWLGWGCSTLPGWMAKAAQPTTRAERRARREAIAGGVKVGSDGKCHAVTRSKRLCKRPAGWGTDHVGTGACKLHGGSMTVHKKRAQRVEAEAAVQAYGLPRTVDPFTALLEELARTAGHVQWLGVQVAQLEEGNMYGPVGGEVHPKAEPHVWIRLYQEERSHLSNVAATCIKAGIEERRVRIAEQQGQLIAQVISGVLNELGVAADVARPVVRKHLALVQSTAQEEAA